MATEKRLIATGDVLYIIGKYSFSPSEIPQVVEVQVAYKFRKQFFAYPTKGHGTFKFSNSDLGNTVFYNRKDAEAALAKMYGERRSNA